MKNLILMFIILVVFIFGYYVMTKVDRIADEACFLISRGRRNGQSTVRIAAENPMLLDSVGPALESCSNADPHIAFFLSSGQADRILEKLSEDRIDLALLSDGNREGLDRQYAVLRIPYRKIGVPLNILGLPVENLDEDRYIQVVWKRGTNSKNRSRVLFALEHEYGRLKSGYADYLNE